MEVDPSERPDVLLVEDNPGDARLIEHELRTEASAVFETPELTHVESLAAATEALERGRFDIVLLDLGLTRTSGLDTLDRLQAALEDATVALPVVVLTGLSDHGTALSAIQAGAQDYLIKDDIDGGALERSIRYALERHRQERELKRQNERLERFASVVSHDLRNPLNVAQGTVASLARDADEDDRESFDRAMRAHDRMATIIDDVLTLARQGQTVDETEPVSLSVVAEECRDTVAADVDLRVDCERTVDADATRLQQLFENLLRNAVEHGGEDVTVSVAALEDGFAVADDGPGIPADRREEVFEAGFTTTDDGTGLGLNIVEDIAEAHGWRVRATDSADGGARFEFTGVEFA